MKPPILDEILTKDVDPSAVDDVWDRLSAKRTAQRRGPAHRSTIAAAAFAALVVILAFTYLRTSPHEPTALRLASGETLPTLLGGENQNVATFDDGSRIVLERASALMPTKNSGGAVAFELRQGEALFDIVPHGPRAWTIDAGFAQVSVLGTRFRVVRGAHDVRVDVERGVVRVSGAMLPVGGRTLTAGQSIDVREDGADATAPRGTDAATPQSTDETARGKATTGGTSEKTSWKPLATKGDFGKAYAALGSHGVASETKRAATPAELLQLADVARLSGHPAEAIAPLERLLEAHRDDERAALAAFTLGKIRQDALDAPASAADALEMAISLGLPDALREDAFARRVEAYAKAGKTSRAQAARTAYEDAFPTGRYRRDVDRWAPRTAVAAPVAPSPR